MNGIRKILDLITSDNMHVCIKMGLQFKPWKIPAVVGSIVVVDMLTHCALLYSFTI